MNFNGAGIVQLVRSTFTAMLAPILLLGLAGCSDAPSDEASGPPPNPLMYEIASADGTVEGWLIGTIHALPDGTKWRTPAIALAVNEADFLLVEIAALDDRAALAEVFAALGTTPGMPPIAERIPATLAPTLADMLDSGGLDSGSFASTETWAAALTLAQLGAEGDPANGVDRALIREFSGRPVRELEGARAQLAIFDRLPESDQRDLLAAVISEASDSKTQGKKLRRAWLTGDVAALEEATRKGILADPDLRETLLVQRNRAWAEAIIPLLEDEPRPLIAVGAAHLVGAEGLASQLQAAGYRVRRLP
ncbi:MAG: TraB/GumN family protein [Alphaproteobacteria bacterium HGW-Alphaproteobacteria-14]|nr:MAG: TraB/GumN family protein [Alphaproteobacteria bacterium HGW-Alphaproteobacteria-14]